MVSKTCVFIFICVGLFVAIPTLLPKASALKRTDIDEYMVEDKLTRMRQNYAEQRARDSEYSTDGDYIGPKYAAEAPRPDEPLRDPLLDYANMMRNDVFLLDNSAETRTRGTGNIKVKKQNRVLPGVPCTCENRSELINLTKDWGIVYPYMVRNVTCSDTCVKPYKCQRKIYNITILKMRREILTLSGADIDKLNQGFDMPLPSRELVRRWAPATVPVTTGCHCTLA